MAIIIGIKDKSFPFHFLNTISLFPYATNTLISLRTFLVKQNWDEKKLDPFFCRLKFEEINWARLIIRIYRIWIFATPGEYILICS